MTFHVPFNQRASSQRPPQPIYIGFEAPEPPRPKFNWWGFNGMWMSFVSLMFAGFPSIVTLPISLMGLRRPGKVMAGIGTTVSLIGLLIAGTITASVVGHQQARSLRRERAIMQKQLDTEVKTTNKLLTTAKEDLVEFRGSNDGYLPTDLEGNIMVVGYVDPWGESLRYEPQDGMGIIRSAGPDSEFLTSDDIATSVKGKSTAVEKEEVPVDLAPMTKDF